MGRGLACEIGCKCFSEGSIACSMKYSPVGSGRSSGQTSRYFSRRNLNSILTLQLFANISTPDIPIPLMYPRLPSVHCLVLPLPDVSAAWCAHCLMFPLPCVSKPTWHSHCLVFPLPDISTATCFHCQCFHSDVSPPAWCSHCLLFSRLSGISIAWCSNYVMFPPVFSRQRSGVSATVF